MNFTLHHVNHHTLATLPAAGVAIRTPQDALDLIGNAGYQGARGVVLQAAQFAPGFFDLRTGLAGEVLQKFSNYGLRLAIVGDFAGYDSKALQDFIRESNRQGRVCFVGCEAEAWAALTRG